MKINFPERGDVLYASRPDGLVHFVSAPLNAAFVLNPDASAVLGQDHTIVDNLGTRLTYRLCSAIVATDAQPRGTGYLVSVEHVEQNVVPVAEHDAKISTAIDTAFEAGRQVEAQERDEALEELVDYFDEPANVHVLFADGTKQTIVEATGLSELEGDLMIITAADTFVGIHPSWRSFEVEDIDQGEDEDDDAELIGITLKDEPQQKGETAECGCDACQCVREADAASDPLMTEDEAAAAGLFRYGVIGERAGEMVLPADVVARVDKAIGDAFDAAIKAPGRLFRFGPVGNRIDD